jgi:cytochrome c-type biogenesis protein CcmH/NrfF
VVFYTIIFAFCAVLLVVGGLTVWSRNRRTLEAEKRAEANSAHARRQQRNAARAQSRKDRRKR